MSTYFMEKSYVVAAIFKVKQLYFRKSFVTLYECNKISNLLQKEYNNKNMNVCITNDIDSNYFKTLGEIIILNQEKNVDLESIEQRYQGYVPDINILLTLWNDSFILKILNELKPD